MIASEAADELAIDTSYVYRCYDCDIALLYIGVSDNVKKRLHEHKSRSLWFPMMAAFTVEEFSSRTAAEQHERDSISAEKPRFNVVNTCRLPAHITMPEKANLDEMERKSIMMLFHSQKLADLSACSGIHRRTLERIRSGKQTLSPWTLARLQPVLARLAKKGSK